ncbi:hypothetical protein O3G_MSEX013871 [Manduca sexta]|uniref:Peptidase M14 domain-containing protein n=1 Tax=Manduca sexta TaxID=7130 RepID=A0A921ZUY4_MANSE|nr:hypothetical protein O3G_MSEX013871 [Manduca sexta]
MHDLTELEIVTIMLALLYTFVVSWKPLLLYALENDIVKYTLYEVTAYNQRERAFLYSLHINNDKYIFVNGVTNEAAIPIYVIVKECCLELFEKDLYANNIDFTYIKSNILWDKPNSKLKSSGNKNSTPINSFYNSFKMKLWIEVKLKKHSMFSKIIIGKTYETKDLIAIKMSVGKKKCAVLVVGGEEGRDWMSPAIILNFIENILESKELINKLLEYCDFYFLPVFNADGYEYSLRKDKLWVKNRKVFFPKKMCNDRVAIGVNIDRNWFFNKASNLYAGERPISEEEPQALFRFMNNMANNLLMYINVRSFDRLITIPYGYTTEYSNNHLILMEILSATCDKLYNIHNATYFYGNTANILYNFSGNSADWVKEKFNIPIVMTVYLKFKDHLFPNETHIQPLTKQFTSIMVEILPVVNNIYGPLFSNHKSCFKFTNRFIIASLLLHTLINIH